MSSVSSLSSNNSLYDWLQSINGTAQTTSTAATSSATSGSSTTPIASPQNFLTTELEAQGYTGSQLSDLQTQIQQAVQSLQQSSTTGTVDPSAIHDTINQVLQNAGVNTDQIASDAQAMKAHGGHHHHHASSTSSTTDTDSDADSTSSTASTDGTSSTSTDSSSDSIDSLLQNLGVDPTKFKSALEKAIANMQNGTADFSGLFASAGTGTQINVLA